MKRFFYVFTPYIISERHKIGVQLKSLKETNVNDGYNSAEA